MNYFDGKFETTHLERGQSYGIPRSIYQKLAQASISVYELCGVEPQILEHLPDGRPGCCCVLYGKHFCYTIQIEMKNPPVAVLSRQGLDDCDQFACVCGGAADSFDVWRQIVSHILEAEGFVSATSEELEEWGRQHGFI